MRSREKVLAVFSACCIIIATFGFLSIPQFFDNSINKLKNENVDLRTRQDITLDLTSKANTYQDTARLQRDSLDLLEGMGAGPETLERKGRDVFNLYRISALDAVNAAVNSGGLTPREADNAVRRMEGIKTYDELREVYREHIRLAGAGVRQVQESADANKKEIVDLSMWKSTLWYIFIAFQSMGMILALFALFFKETE